MNFNDYQRPSVAVDTVLFRCVDIDRGHRKGNGKELQVLLIKRKDEPFVNSWSLPGGFMSCESGNLYDTAKNKLLEKTGISNVYIEQLATFDMLNRDPRGRVLSVTYLGVTNEEKYTKNESYTHEAKWFSIKNNSLETENIILNINELAFDHGTIIVEALNRLKNKIDYSDLAFYLLPEKFTIKEAQLLFEVVLGYRIDSFRRKLGKRVLETEEFVQRVGKPAQLFVFNKDWKKEEFL